MTSKFTIALSEAIYIVPIQYYTIFMPTLLLGAAHGLSTILLVLISFPQYIEVEQQARDDIKKCIDQFITLQTTNGNFPTRILKYGEKQRSEEDELVHWCHGAPGK